jgi:hypothetical protein
LLDWLATEATRSNVKKAAGNQFHVVPFSELLSDSASFSQQERAVKLSAGRRRRSTTFLWSLASHAHSPVHGDVKKVAL